MWRARCVAWCTHTGRQTTRVNTTSSTESFSVEWSFRWVFAQELSFTIGKNGSLKINITCNLFVRELQEMLSLYSVTIEHLRNACGDSDDTPLWPLVHRKFSTIIVQEVTLVVEVHVWACLSYCWLPLLTRGQH